MSQLFILLAQLLNLLSILIIVRILLGWISPQSYYRREQQPMKALYAITEPVMAPFRALIPPIGGIDFSPIILFVVIGIAQRMLMTMAAVGPF